MIAVDHRRALIVSLAGALMAACTSQVSLVPPVSLDSPAPVTSVGQTAPPPSPGPTSGDEVGASLEGIPTSVAGSPVLRGDALRAAMTAATDATSILAGGWVQGAYSRPSGFCTAFRPPLAIDTCENGLILFDEQVGWTRTLMTGGDPSILRDSTLLVGDRPVVLRVHTHDAACAQSQAGGFDCLHLPVASAVEWLGAVASARPSPTPVGTPPAPAIARADAIDLARSRTGERPGATLTVHCAEFAPYSQVWTDQIPPPQPDRWLWSVVFTGGRWRSDKVSVDYQTGALVTAMGADWLQPCLGETAPAP